MTEDEKNTEQPKVNTWMRKREQDCIARGWKRGNKTGGAAIISPRLCEKLKEAQEKAEEEWENKEKE